MRVVGKWGLYFALYVLIIYGSVWWMVRLPVLP